jgi:rhodanese-related sulfurtransferase
VLYENGYTYVDVRPALELSEVGKVVGCVNVPLYNSKKVFDKQQNKKVVKKEKNNDFLKTFEKKFPDKKAKLLIACSDAKTYSMDALEQLDDAGYENLVALSGGYYAWYQVFDNKLGRRRYGEYQEDWRHEANSAGIHASGAGFEKIDPLEKWVPPVF